MPIRKSGFSIIQMLAVVGVIIFAVVFVLIAVEPGRRRGQARDAERLIAVNAILDAILEMQALGRRNFTGAASAPLLADDKFAQVIVMQDDSIDCSDPNQRPGCDVSLSDAAGTGCVVNLGRGNGQLMPDYLDAMPVDPRDGGQVPACASDSDCAFKGNLFYGPRNSGYYIHKNTSGRIEIGACKPDRPEAVSITSDLSPQ